MNSRLLRFGALLSIVTFCWGGNLWAAPAKPNTVQLLLKPKPSMTEAALSAILAAHGAADYDLIRALKVHIIRVPAAVAPKLLDALQHHGDVEYAEPDFTATALGSANDPLFTQGSEWHLLKIGAPSAWDVSTGSVGVVVAVIDSGVRASHPDLAGKILPGGYDFFANDTDPTDENGHGTAVAGTIAPASNNGLGVAGVAWANPILPIRALGADGSGSYSAIANSIIYAADNGARILNMSLGGTSSSTTLQDAVNYAWNKQCVLVAAAGNNGNNVPFYPAACKNVIAVSATNASDTRPSWSNFGTFVDVCAPGENIATLSGADQYGSWSGTSFSSPVTAGVLALMASVNPQLSNAQLVDLLLNNSDDLGTLGYDVYYGYGRVNAFRAVTAARNLASADLTAPVVTITSPTDGSTVAGSVSITLSATDNVGVSRLDLYFDSVLIGQSTSSPATFPLNTLSYANGAHSLQARAYDLAGNIGSSSISLVIQNNTVVDSIAPTAAITSPSNGSVISSNSLKINVIGSDNIAVSKLQLYVDGKLFGTSNTTSAIFSWNTAKASKGAHTLQAYASDAAGNLGASEVVTVWK